MSFPVLAANQTRFGCRIFIPMGGQQAHGKLIIARGSRQRRKLWSLPIGLRAYLLKYIHAVSANKTIATIQRDESLISVFLAMGPILDSTSPLCQTVES